MSYKAFISYRRAPDEKLAQQLKGALCRIGRAPYQRSLFRVFRDKSNLSAAPGLWSSIEDALRETEFFIYLASPESTRSPWVQRELEWWLANRGTAGLLLTVTVGEVVWDSQGNGFDMAASTAIPSILRGRFSEVPLWVDMRWTNAESKLSLRHARFRDSVADLAAPLYGISKEQLLRDDVRVQRRTLRLAWTGVGLLVLLLAIAIQQTVLAKQRQATAFARQLAVRAALVRNEYPSYVSRAVLLAAESLKRSYSIEAERVARDGVTVLTRPEREFRDEQPLSHVTFSSDSRYAAASESASKLHSEHATLWDITTGQVVRYFIGAGDGGISFSADGKYLAMAGSTEGIVRVWVAATGAAVTTIHHGDGAIIAAFHPSKSLLLTAGNDGIVRISEARSGAEVRSVRLGGPVMHASFSADGRRIAAGSNTGSSLVWAWENGQSFRPPALSSLIRSTAFSGDGRYVALSSDDGQLRIFDRGGNEAYRFRGSRDSVIGSIAFQPKGQYLAASSDDNSVRVWDLDGGYEIPALRHDHSVDRVVFSPNSQFMATASQDRTAVVWDTKWWRQALVLPHDHFVDDVAFSPDGKLVATAGYDRVVRVWSTAAASVDRLFGDSPLPPSIAMSPDGRSVLIGDEVEIRCVDTATGHRIRWQIQGEAAGIGFTPDGAYAGAATSDGRVAVIRMSDGKHMSGFQTDSTPVQIALSRDGGIVAVSTRDRTIELWDTLTRTKIRTLAVNAFPQQIALDSDGTYVALTTGGHEVAVWAVRSGERRFRLNADCPAFGAAFAPKADLLAVAAASDTCQSTRVWDLRTGTKVADFTFRNVPGQTGGINVLLFSADYRRLAVATGDHAVRIFDIGSGQQVSHLTFVDYPAAAAFVDGGRSLRTVSQDGVMRTSTLDTNELVRQACAKVGRDLTPDEWLEYLGNEPYRRTCAF